MDTFEVVLSACPTLAAKTPAMIATAVAVSKRLFSISSSPFGPLLQSERLLPFCDRQDVISGTLGRAVLIRQAHSVDIYVNATHDSTLSSARNTHCCANVHPDSSSTAITRMERKRPIMKHGDCPADRTGRSSQRVPDSFGGRVRCGARRWGTPERPTLDQPAL